MDDFVLFSDQSRQLEESRALIIEWLDRERSLTLKNPSAEPLDNRLPAIFLGFRVSRAGFGPGPKALRRLRLRLRQTDRLGPEKLARSLRSFRGMWGALGG